MALTRPPELSRRERQIMDVLYRKRRATAAEIVSGLSGKPSSSTVRTQLRVLERKGHVRHKQEGLRFVYQPVVSRPVAAQSALRHLIRTFFEGSVERTMSALVRTSRSKSDGRRLYTTFPSDGRGSRRR